MKVTGAEIGGAGLAVSFGDTTPTVFPWMWLRDHGEDAESLDPGTWQRKVDTFAIEADLRGVGVETIDDGARLRVTWSDNSPQSEFSARLLAEMVGLVPGEDDPGAGLDRNLWAAGSLPATMPSVGFDAVMSGDAGIRRWLENIHVWGFSLVHDVPASEEGTKRLAERMGYVRQTIFGGLWTLSAEIKDHGDTAYTTQYLEPHTDSTYCHDAPGLQLFNCIEFDGRGGESVLVDGFALAERLRAGRPDDFETLTRTMVPGRYVEPGVHLRAERPPFRLDRRGRLEQVTFNNYDRAPFMPPLAEMAAFYRAYGAFHEAVVDQRNWLKIRLEPGLALIFDNWRLLHGRMGYTGKRVFCGCYHNREDFESRLRTVRLAA
jgi:trimethyllysine dioxygenase